MGSSGQLKYDELWSGGTDGVILYDATVSTAIATGLNYDLLDVRIAVTFATLDGWDYLASTGIDFIVDNGWSPSIGVGYLFAGNGRKFTSITLTGTAGQILAITQSNS